MIGGNFLKLIVTEKKSVAEAIAAALNATLKRGDGFFENNSYVITWRMGHLVEAS